MKNIILKIFFLSVFIFSFNSTDSLAKKIRIGSLQYGSVNWELKLIQDLDLDKKNSFELEIVELASKNAAAVALQGGDVSLDESIKYYEIGVLLKNHCEDKLKNAEIKIKKVIDNKIKNIDE